MVKKAEVKNKKLDRERYDELLHALQIELNQLARWALAEGKRVLVLFEGRDAAGKGGAIEAISSCLSKPTERERTQWYFQRYVPYLPAAGEIVLFDRSWYNRAGVEKVMGFCTPEQHAQFLKDVPVFEQMLINDGIVLRKYYLSCDQEKQEKRFKERVEDPLKRWKISPIDLQAREKYDDYTAARELMFKASHTKESPWNVVDMNDQKRGRLQLVRHLLDSIPDHDVKPEPIEFPKLKKKVPSVESFKTKVNFITVKI
jgi:polyphosphate kinase